MRAPRRLPPRLRAASERARVPWRPSPFACAGSLPCQGFRLLDDDTPVAESSSDQNRFVVETDLVVRRNAIVDGSLTVRTRRFARDAHPGCQLQRARSLAAQRCVVLPRAQAKRRV